MDDVAFLRAIIDWSARHGTTPGRGAVVAGISNGAFMAHRMAHERATWCRSLAAVAGGLPVALRDREPGHAVSAMLIHGTADEVVPIDGRLLPTPRAERRIARPDFPGGYRRVLARHRPLPARAGRAP